MTRPAHVPEKAYNEAMERLVSASDKWTKGICAGGYLGESGGEVEYKQGYAWSGNVCHNHITFSNTFPLHFDTHKEGKDKTKNKEACLAFCKYMLLASPVRNFILNDTVESLYHGGAIIDCRCGPAALLWICKSFRCMYEDYWRIPNWFLLTQRGVHPMLAWCVAQITTFSWLLHYGQTHNSVMIKPTTEGDMKSLFIDHLPEHLGLCKHARGSWDGEWWTSSVFKGEKESGPPKHPLPSLSATGIVKEIPDGWGGFTEKIIGVSVDDLAKELIAIQKEYLK